MGVVERYVPEVLGRVRRDLRLRKLRLFRRRLYRQQDALVTFSDAGEIFGQRTIRISNGVDFDSIPLHEYNNRGERSEARGEKNELHLIGVAEVHTWHGYDRLVAGMGEYYKSEKLKVKSEKCVDVFFHIVGGVHPAEMERSFTPLLKKYPSIEGRVIFHGQLFGDELTRVFNQCRFAIGSLGRHRSGITVIKTLKNREYATRGIPFIYSEQDSDFDQQPYVLKAPADESPIDIQRIIDFTSHFTMQPAEIRRSVEHLTWKIQMQRVVEQVFNGEGA